MQADHRLSDSYRLLIGAQKDRKSGQQLGNLPKYKGAFGISSQSANIQSAPGTRYNRTISELLLPGQGGVRTEESNERSAKGETRQKLEAIKEHDSTDEGVPDNSSPNKQGTALRTPPSRRSKRIANSKITTQLAAERTTTTVANVDAQKFTRAKEVPDHRPTQTGSPKKTIKADEMAKEVLADVDMDNSELDINKEPVFEYPDELSMPESDDEDESEWGH